MSFPETKKRFPAGRMSFPETKKRFPASRMSFPETKILFLTGRRTELPAKSGSVKIGRLFYGKKPVTNPDRSVPLPPYPLQIPSVMILAPTPDAPYPNSAAPIPRDARPAQKSIQKLSATVRLGRSFSGSLYQKPHYQLSIVNYQL